MVGGPADRRVLPRHAQPPATASVASRRHRPRHPDHQRSGPVAAPGRPRVGGGHRQAAEGGGPDEPDGVRRAVVDGVGDPDPEAHPEQQAEPLVPTEQEGGPLDEPDHDAADEPDEAAEDDGRRVPPVSPPKLPGKWKMKPATTSPIVVATTQIAPRPIISRLPRVPVYRDAIYTRRGRSCQAGRPQRDGGPTRP